MSTGPIKGGFSADIPADAVAEALKSVERIKRSGDAPADPEIEVGGAGPEEETQVDLEPGAPEGESPELLLLRTQLELSQQKGRETLEKLREEHERAQRAVADLDAYKKRAIKEKDEVQRFGSEKLVKDLLPVIDNLDRALKHAAPEDPLADGVKMVLKQVEDVLGRHGVKAFSALGKPFDPNVHEAMQQVQGADAAPGTVVMEHARGFTLHGRLVRPAMVGIAAPRGGET
jgi:molecular chaperone GrpE